MSPRKPRYRSASDVAKLAFCERKVVFDEAFGDEGNAYNRARRLEGESLHAELAGGHGGKVSRCFIATAVFGAASPETMLLRLFRDHVLRRVGAGRAFIGAYYRVGPHLARLFGRPPWDALARAALRGTILPVARLWLRFARVRTP